jgi:hypothetical protein
MTCTNNIMSNSTIRRASQNMRKHTTSTDRFLPEILQQETGSGQRMSKRNSGFGRLTTLDLSQSHLSVSGGGWAQYHPQGVSNLEDISASRQSFRHHHRRTSSCEFNPEWFGCANSGSSSSGSGGKKKASNRRLSSARFSMREMKSSSERKLLPSLVKNISSGSSGGGWEAYHPSANEEWGANSGASDNDIDRRTSLIRSNSDGLGLSKSFFAGLSESQFF